MPTSGVNSLTLFWWLHVTAGLASYVYHYSIMMFHLSAGTDPEIHLGGWSHEYYSIISA